MVASLRDLAWTHQAEDLTELRVLLELRALRMLANRGLSDQELALVKRQAEATMSAASRGDIPGYLRADMVFHLSLLKLTGDPALSEIAAVLLTPDGQRAPGALESRDRMARAAREHGELAVMLADGMVSEADHLLRLHLSRSGA